MSKTFGKYKAPFIVFSAGIDKLCDPLLGFDLADQSPSTDKTHIFYDQCWHNMWGENEIYDAITKT